jgi:hypothetical protein
MKKLIKTTTLILCISTISATMVNYTAFANTANQVDQHTGQAVRVITYDQALSMAIARNNNIIDLRTSQTMMEDQRNALNNSLGDAQFHGNTSAINSTQRGINTVDTQVSNTRTRERILREAVEFSLLNFLTNIEKLKLDIALLNTQIQLAQTEVRNAELRYSLNLGSFNDIFLAEQRLIDAQIALNRLEISLQSEQQGLNNFIGVNVNQPVHIQYNPQFNPINIHIDTHINRHINASPQMEILRRESQNANFAAERRTLGENQSQLDFNAQSATRSLNEERQNIERTLRTEYHMLRGIEQGIVSLQNQLERANRDLQLMQVNYQAGTIIYHQVVLAQSTILRIETDLQKMKLDHALLNHKFNNVYL